MDQYDPNNPYGTPYNAQQPDQQFGQQPADPYAAPPAYSPPAANTNRYQVGLVFTLAINLDTSTPQEAVDQATMIANQLREHLAAGAGADVEMRLAKMLQPEDVEKLERAVDSL